MSTQDSADREALRAEIQAAIAAGRELSPDMDQHLADSALDRYQREREAREKALGVQPARPAPVVAQPGGGGTGIEPMARALVTVAAIAAFLAILAFQPHMWWVIFFMPAIAGWWGWGRGSRHHHYYDRSRRDMRGYRRRMSVEELNPEFERPRTNAVEYD